MKQKLIGFILGQNCEETIRLAAKSLAGCDEIIYLDGGSTDSSMEIADVHCDVLLENTWNNTKVGMCATQKNYMLDYLKKHHKGDWCIYIDSDEMLDDIDKLKVWIDKYGDVLLKRSPMIAVKMRHLMNDLVHEDDIFPEHHALTRLFKIVDGLNHPIREHSIMRFNEKAQLKENICRAVTIWHLAYCGGIWDIKRRYDGQMGRIGKGGHSKETINNWRNAHLLHRYPIRKLDVKELPVLLLKEFDIDKDEFYFEKRGIEVKHPIMVKQWFDYFKPKSVLDLGCGRGPYLYFWNWFVKLAVGIELSEWAVKNAFVDTVMQGDISEEINKEGICFYGDENMFFYDLITAIDVLEHLDDNQLDKTLTNMAKYGKKFIFSIPFEGDSNLLKDKTHKQFHIKEWWQLKIESYGIKLEETPKNWTFNEQTLIGRKND